MRNLTKNKRGESFKAALVVILLSIAIFSIAFISEERGITGLVIDTEPNDITSQSSLIEYNDVNSLGTLSEGNYYIDGNGIVYWVEDESEPAIAKVEFLYEEQKNRYIYIDDEGNVGYLLK